MYYLRLMFRGLSGCLLLALLAVSAAFAGDDQNLLAYPVQDARDTFRSGQYEFVGIQLADGVELPGLKDAEAQTVRRDYRIRPLNKRWETFANVEDDPAKLLRLRQYALRFNLTMWRLLQKKELQDATRYRY
ncbi:MAG: hypothetical protein COB09_14760 [Thalassobium sp.]|jgi:hypothetical protein|uniref:Uncharacterized protein n=1 Tax=Thalassolituus pacificus TaxID=2975440 RepID=A0A9X2WIB8_9GAMM|nr:hypothetical protein [Thalassolituus pacificus]MCT7360967.1 hypothetical protein [Thalassolituus pacificus]PHS62341.1 MAG: hypothetical protein COB09_14760 [Thalassobium sp.]